MFENVDGRTTDAGVTGILLAHLGAFGSGELKAYNIITMVAITPQYNPVGTKCHINCVMVSRLLQA